MVVAALAVPVATGCGDGGGETVAGSGYEYELPDGWSDANESSEELAEIAESEIPAQDLGVEFDSLAADQPTNGFSTNLNVTVEGSLASEVDSRRYAELNGRIFRDPRLRARFLPPSFELLRGPTPAQEVQVGDETGFAFDIESEVGARRLGQRFVGVVHDGTGYAITFTALADDLDSEAAELEAILDSWRWDP